MKGKDKKKGGKKKGFVPFKAGKGGKPPEEATGLGEGVMPFQKLSSVGRKAAP